MVSVDLFRKFPTIRTRANALESVARNTVTLDKANTKRSTTLDRVPGNRPRRKADTGPDNPARLLPDIDDSGIYIASADGRESGVSFDVMPARVGLVAPALDLGE